MLTYTNQEIKRDGKHEIILTFPCFIENSPCRADSFYTAARMNGFYLIFLHKVYEYALSFDSSDVRRSSFICHADTQTANEVITVTLDLSLRRTEYQGRSKTLHRRLTHKWKNGILIGCRKE